MVQVSNLSEMQLKKIIQESQAELIRRDAISKATQDVIKILQKYKLTTDDIDLPKLLSSNSTKSRRTTTQKPSIQKKKRGKVAPKFKSIDATQNWTGRGKAPRWVVALCEEENLTIDAFKNDLRFRI